MVTPSIQWLFNATALTLVGGSILYGANILRNHFKEPTRPVTSEGKSKTPTLDKAVETLNLR